MSPVLAQAADDLDVSTATAGQLRTVTGVAAGVTALLVSVGLVRLELARQLLFRRCSSRSARSRAQQLPTTPLSRPRRFRSGSPSRC